MIGVGVTYRAKRPPGAAGKVFLTVFFLFFLGMGLAFAWLVAREAVAALATWTWRPTDCQILSSQVSDTDSQGRGKGDFHFRVSYRYTFEGRTFVSDKDRRNPGGFPNYEDAARLMERYPEGSGALCYVNPAKPEEAVLKRGSLWFPLFILFPLIFVAIGAGGIYSTWSGRVAGNPHTPISNSARPFGQFGANIFFGVFALMGGGFLFFFIRPAIQSVESRDWPAVPCVVISSEAQYHSGSHGGTYSINILYRYSVGGREYKSNRYGFMGGSSSGYEGKAAVVRQYPPGRETVCYVNPNQPWEAVLNRRFTKDMWFGLIPLTFLFIGCAGLVFAFRQKRLAAAAVPLQPMFSRPAAATAAPEVGNGPATGPKWLKPAMGPAFKLVGAILVATFWNGIISVFLIEAIHGWRTGHGQWFLTIFLIPFVAMGVFLIGAVIYCFLSLFNPRPHLKIAPEAVRAGGSLRIDWELAGKVERLENLRIRLEAREEATQGSGKSSSTRTSVFLNSELMSVTSAPAMHSGNCKVSIPADAMHSFTAPSNKVIWAIKVEGRIRRWPDLKAEFPLTVLPAEHGRRKDT